MLVKSRIKYIQSLGQKKFRQQEGLFIAEGPKIVEELMKAAPTAVKEIYALPAWAGANRDLVGSIPVIDISEKELERISQLAAPHQVLAVVEQFKVAAPVRTAGKIILALDRIQDPGNLGTIIRIADWFGVEQLVCSPDCAEIYNPKVVQASMGSIARVSVWYFPLEEWLAEHKDARVYATVLEGKPVTEIKKPEEGIILIGNESKGISPELLALSAERITIPRKGRAESLNAAVAAGIILSHLTIGR